MNIFGFVLRQFYPQRCVFCDHIVHVGVTMCEACKEKLDGYRNYYPDYTKYGKVKCVSPFIYDGLGKNAISILKFRNSKYNAKVLASFMIKEIDKHYRDIKFDHAAYIPANPKKKISRGYNPVEGLFEEIAPAIGVSNKDRLLIKVRNTKDQKTLSFQERLKNLEGAFAVSSKIDIRGKTVLLIDDVKTTGVTLDTTAKLLYEAGAERVFAATFAVAKRKSREP